MDKKKLKVKGGGEAARTKSDHTKMGGSRN